MDEEGNQFVAYFLPHEETIRKRKRDCDEGMDYMPEDLYVRISFQPLCLCKNRAPIIKMQFVLCFSAMNTR